MRTALLLALALVLAAAGCGGDDESEPAAPATTAEVSAAGCAPEQVVPKPDGSLDGPTTKLDPKKTYSLVFETNCGAFTVELDQQLAPSTAASLVFLAKRDFFDGISFHRIVPGFVIQGGDPTATGTGGPGYKTVDPPPAAVRYTHGVVAMAKSGVEAPGTAGSQFFVVTGEDVGLPAEYAVVGEVSSGLDVVDRIGTLGDPTTEEPTENVVIRDVRVLTSS
jgi:peptidyl-prolyl cis-trans isomerase B (cyclophilin B)